MKSNLSLKTFDDAVKDLLSKGDKGLPERFARLNKKSQQHIISRRYPDVVIEKDSIYRP